jgi:hypothetical protein
VFTGIIEEVGIQELRFLSQGQPSPWVRSGAPAAKIGDSIATEFASPQPASARFLCVDISGNPSNQHPNK